MIRTARVVALGSALLALTLGAGVAPATAVSAASDTTIITVKGHVTDPDGRGVAGILVSGGCPGTCSGRGVFDRDHTTRTGLFVLHLRRQYAKYVYASDHTKTYLDRAVTRTWSHDGSAYVLDVVMQKASLIQGAVTVPNGGDDRYVSVAAFDARTGKGAGSAGVHDDGSYTLRVPAGDYKLKFGGASYYVQDGWYGGAPTRATSPTVSVGYGATVTGIDATVLPKPTITGIVRLDGERVIDGVKDRAIATVTDAAGAVVQRRATLSGHFSFVELAPGTYTLTISPSSKGAAFFTPVSRSITLTADSAAEKTRIDVTSVPITAVDPADTELVLAQRTTGIPKPGRPWTAVISAESYGAVAGGTMKVYLNGAKVATKMVPASGRVTVTFRPRTVVFGSFEIAAAFTGTDTATKRGKVGVYYLSGD